MVFNYYKLKVHISQIISYFPGIVYKTNNIDFYYSFSITLISLSVNIPFSILSTISGGKNFVK